jgi:hypothetical protein
MQKYITLKLVKESNKKHWWFVYSIQWKSHPSEKYQSRKERLLRRINTLQEFSLFPTKILVGMEPNFVGIVAFPTTVPTKWFVGTKAAIPTHYLRKFVGTVCQRVSALFLPKFCRKRILVIRVSMCQYSSYQTS